MITSRTISNIWAMIAGIAAICALAFWAQCAEAGGWSKPDPKHEQKQKQHMNQEMQQEMQQQQKLNVETEQRLNVANELEATGGDASANNEGITMTVDGDNYDIPVSTAYAPPAYTQHRCGSVLGIGATRDDGSMSVGIQTPYWLSRQLRDCYRRNDAAWSASIGAYDDAIEIRCRTKSMQIHYGSTDDCVAKLSEGRNTNAELNELRQSVQILRDERDTLNELREHDQEVCDDRLGIKQEEIERCNDTFREKMAK